MPLYETIKQIRRNRNYLFILKKKLVFPIANNYKNSEYLFFFAEINVIFKLFHFHLFFIIYNNVIKIAKNLKSSIKNV